MHGHQVLAPAASLELIVCVANSNRDCVASSSTNVSSSVVTASLCASYYSVSSSTVVYVFCASRVHVGYSLVWRRKLNLKAMLEGASERDASACMRRHQAFALAPVRFIIY
jgi:hypothetical protein